MTITFSSESDNQTVQLGQLVGNALPSRAVVALSGPLGSGKTAMVRGIVESRTNDDVSSPTFVYHQRYGSTAQPIDHIDLYRVKDDQIKLASSGILDIIETVPGWVLIEWPLNDMKFPPAVPVVTVAASGPPTFRFAITTHDPAILAALSKRV